jgi:hypothetical protein
MATIREMTADFAVRGDASELTARNLKEREGLTNMVIRL